MKESLFLKVIYFNLGCFIVYKIGNINLKKKCCKIFNGRYIN